jgi:hypothetical protein
MVYVASTSRTLLWGGLGEDATGDPMYTGDTWDWDGEGWVQVADTGPHPFGFVGLAFDSTRNVVVLFTSNEANTAWNTWEWDGEGWTQVEDDGPHAAQGTFSMVYDSARSVTLLEGGSLQGGSASFPPVGTWIWDGTAWTQVADVGPSQRAYGGLGYDQSRQRVVHFGGVDLGAATLPPDTWEWDGTTWEQVADIGPAPRVGHAMSGTVLFGGGTEASELLRDTWTWDGTYWRQRQDIGPAKRLFGGFSWDGGRNRAVLFGGLTVVDGVGANLGDTWESLELP